MVPYFDLAHEFAVEMWLLAPEALRDDPAVRALLDFIGGYRGDPSSVLAGK